MLFLGEGDIPPKYLIGANGGVAVPARMEVVEIIQMELRRTADLTRQQIRRCLKATLSAPVEEPIQPLSEDVSVPEYLPGDEGTLAQLLAGLVSNPTVADRRR